MTAKMKKSSRDRNPSNLAEGPTCHRRQHTPFTCDVLTPPGAPVIARHRARAVLTPLAARREIIEEASGKPEAVRVRSLRRRLTILDRALSDQEAEAVERLTTCINGLSNIGCLNYLKSEVRADPVGRLPFSETRRREIGAMTYVLRGLGAVGKSCILDLAALLDPSHSLASPNKPSSAFIDSVRSSAGVAVILYERWRRQEIERDKAQREQE